MPKQQVTKNGNGKPPAIMTPDLFSHDAGVGVDNLTTEDLAIPFLKILQKMSDELDDLEGAKAGDIFNTVTKTIQKGKDGVDVINCAYALQFIEWEPRSSGSGAPFAIYQSGDELPKYERGEDNKDYVVDGGGRYLERTAQHYVLLVDENGMTQQALLPMKSTQFKKSKQWNSAMRSLQMTDANGKLFQPPRFSHIWHLQTVPEENKNGSWFGWQISKKGAIESPEIYSQAKLFAESIKAGQVKVQHVREDDSSSSDVPF